MIYTMMHGKLHRATITEANLNYMGSITIDATCLTPQASFPANASRSATIITAPALKPIPLREKRGSGVVCLNGAAARYAR
mgnify:CR=1 FL=1